MTKADKYLVAGILFVALISVVLFHHNFLLSQSRVEGGQACIEVHGKLIKKIDLSEKGRKETIKLQGVMGPATIEIAGNRIRMLDAHCPDQICVRRGWIGKPGESIVCIPNEINIYIERGDMLDAVTR
ncbi:MAG: NusG domain II-containing protein [Geobacter sp.]|nr:MAG: NusG domain II-containing protein [Geobacter sp.]